MQSAALSGSSTERNASSSTKKLSSTTIPIMRGSLSLMRFGEVDVAGGLAAEVGGHVLALDRLRDHVVAQVVDEVLGLASSDGPVVGIAVNAAAVPFLSTIAGETLLMPLGLGDRVLEVGQARIGGRLVGELLLLLELLLLGAGLLL